MFISGLYSEHMLLVSCCWFWLFTCILVCVLDVGWTRLDECPLSFLVLDNFLSLHSCSESFAFLLIQFVSFNFTEIRCWLNHRMTLDLLYWWWPFDEFIHHQNWPIQWISRLWLELLIDDSYKFSYDQKQLHVDQSSRQLSFCFFVLFSFFFFYLKISLISHKLM